MTDGQWLLTLPFRRPPLTGNARWSHWSREREAQQKVQTATWALAKQKRLPRLDAITAELVWYKGDNRRADADNIAPTVKPALDGLVKAHVLPDDNSDRVIRSSTRIVLRRDDPYDASTPRLVLVIRDASALAPLPHYAPEEAAR
jgi:hypothetical protein